MLRSSGRLVCRLVDQEHVSVCSPDKNSSRLTRSAHSPESDDEGRDEHHKVDEPGKVGAPAREAGVGVGGGAGDGGLGAIVPSVAVAVVLDDVCVAGHVLHLAACFVEVVGRKERGSRLAPEERQLTSRTGKTCDIRMIEKCGEGTRQQQQQRSTAFVHGERRRLQLPTSLERHSLP